MKLGRLPLFGVAICFGLPGKAAAGWSCGIDETLLPQVYALEVIDDRLTAYVGPIEAIAGREGATVVGVNAQGNWIVQPRSQLPTRRDSLSSKACMDPPPDKEWLRANRPW